MKEANTESEEGEKKKKKKTKSDGRRRWYLEGLGGAGELLRGAELGAHEALGVLHAHLVEEVVAAGGPGGGGLEG